MAKTVVFFSTKGGVGTTLISSNIALSLARDLNQRVLLIDSDIQAGADMAKMLNVGKSHSSLAEMTDRLKRQAQGVAIGDFITPTTLGVDFMPVAINPRQAHHMETALIKDVFALADAAYQFIVVDGGKGFSENLIYTLNEANLIVLVVTPDILSIYQTKWALDTLQTLQFPLKMVKLILNRADSLSSISWQEVNAALPYEILGRIPSEGRVVMQALNNGIPLIIDNPKSKVALVLKKLAQDMMGQEFPYVVRREITQADLANTIPPRREDIWGQTITSGQGLQFLTAQTEQESTDELLRCKQRIHQRLIEDLKLGKIDNKTFGDPKKVQELRERAEKLVSNLLLEELGSFISSAEVRKKLVKEIMDEALGLGPLEDLLADASVTDIMVNNRDEVYVERGGKLELTNKRFISNDQVRIIMERIIAPLGRRVDESVPMVDARLPDGSRIHAIIPPLAISGPTLTIRKFRKERFTIEELIRLGSLNAAMGDFLKACVIARKNILVSGGTGSGKTTVLNILSLFIPSNERIVTIEDAAELKLEQEHWVRLEARLANIEGKGEVSIRDLFRNCLRMRPDRIIIGECRGAETLDMLQAMNTGHDGSLTTLHANSTQDAIVRLDSMILMAEVEMPLRSIREMISSAIDLILHTSRLSDGSRKVVQISELSGMRDDVHVNMRDIFLYQQTGIDSDGKVIGSYKATGYRPTFAEDIRVRGIPLPDDLFK